MWSFNECCVGVLNSRVAMASYTDLQSVSKSIFGFNPPSSILDPAFSNNPTTSTFSNNLNFSNAHPNPNSSIPRPFYFLPPWARILLSIAFRLGPAECEERLNSPTTPRIQPFPLCRAFQRAGPLVRLLRRAKRPPCLPPGQPFIQSLHVFRRRDKVRSRRVDGLLGRGGEGAKKRIIH